MKTKRINSDISVCDQISADNVSLVGALGFKTIICNRPDGETIDQELFEIIKNLAEKAGLNTEYVPIQSSIPTPSELSKLADVLKNAPKPVLAYCETGARCEAAFHALLLDETGDSEAKNE